MKAEELRAWIDSLTDDIEFYYKGKHGAICPFNRANISVCYGEDEQTFQSVDDTMNTPFIDGKPIRDICGEFTFPYGG